MRFFPEARDSMRMPAPVPLVALLGLFAVTAAYLLPAGRKPDAGREQDGSVTQVWNAMLSEVPLEEFDRVESGPLEFPRDHGAHPNAPLETWSLSAHLRGESGEVVGVQISLARLALVAPDAAPAKSAWGLREIYRGHTILVHGEGGASAEERLRRGFPGIAGYDESSREWRLDDWFLKVEEGLTGSILTVAATIGAGAALELRLEPEKRAISPEVGSADPPFRGYSLTRLTVKGALVTTEGREIVEGTAWFDHLWGDLPFAIGPTVLDRLLLQTDDGSDISLVRTRRRDGGGTPTVEGFTAGPAGEVSQIESAAVTMEPVRSWSPAGEPFTYPVGWRLDLGGGREMVVTPLVDDQLHEFVVPMWSGTVTARGNLGSGPVEAIGTLQLNGYAEP